MFQNPCKTLGFKKNMVYKIHPGVGEVNRIQPVAYQADCMAKVYCSLDEDLTRGLIASSINLVCTIKI